MDLTPDSRIWISDARDAELALAAERARRARERTRATASPRTGLLARLRRVTARAPHPVAR